MPSGTLLPLTYFRILGRRDGSRVSPTAMRTAPPRLALGIHLYEPDVDGASRPARGPPAPLRRLRLLFDLAVLALLAAAGVYRTDGLLFLTYAGVYAAGRFLLTYFRIEQEWFWGLQEAQVVSMAVLAVTALRPRPGVEASR